jgi:hypothetical protein
LLPFFGLFVLCASRIPFVSFYLQEQFCHKQQSCVNSKFQKKEVKIGGKNSVFVRGFGRARFWGSFLAAGFARPARVAEVFPLVAPEVAQVDPKDAGAREASEPTAANRDLDPLPGQSEDAFGFFGRNSAAESWDSGY